jgi:four helix bundle protein
MTEIRNTKKYDLEDRTFKYSKKITDYLKVLSKSMINSEISKQLFRSSCSVGANYIEANEALSRKDFVMRIKICRKECKESIYWLKLIEDEDSSKEYLMREATELMKIFGSILEKCKDKV